MTRVAPLDPPYSDSVAEDLVKLMPPGIPPIRLFRTLAQNPRVLRRVRKGGLLDRGSITVRERELVILRTTALCRSEYEWGVHVAFFAPLAGLTRAQITATITGDRTAFDECDRPVLELCDALHSSSTVSDDVWARLAAGRAADQLVELVALAGQYHSIAYLTNALAIELEPGAPRFADHVPAPPDVNRS